MTRDQLAILRKAITAATTDDRKAVFQALRAEFPIHSLEKEWQASAELILEAIARANDLTKRGVRGVITEAAFHQSVVVPLTAKGWRDETPPGNHPFDFLLTDSIGSLKIQVKMQRKAAGALMHWKSNKEFFVAETQKTRTGKSSTGQDTRPYRFGEFDILAVSMQPSTGKWEDFLYTVGNWLIPRVQNKKLIRVFQPIPGASNDDWCEDVATAIQWVRSGRSKTIFKPPTIP